MTAFSRIVSLLCMLAACSYAYAKDNSNNLTQEQYALIANRIATPSLGLSSGDLYRYSTNDSNYFLLTPSITANYGSKPNISSVYKAPLNKNDLFYKQERRVILNLGDTQALVSTGVRNLYGMRVPHITAAWLIKDGHAIEANYNLRINEKTLSYNYQNYSIGVGANVPLFRSSNAYTVFVKKSIPFQLGSF